MTHTNNEYHQALVLNLCDHPIISYTVFPEPRQIFSKPFSEVAGILAVCDPFPKKVQDILSGLLAQLGEILFCGLVEFNQPTQDAPPLLRG